MKKEKKLLRKRGFLILAALIISCIILATFASCQSSKNTPPNDVQSVETSKSESSTVENNPTSQAAEKMASGGVYVNLSDNNQNIDFKSLTKWFYTNILEKNEGDITEEYTAFNRIADYNGVSLWYVSCKLNSEKPQYLSILLGTKLDSNNSANQYYLIDGKLTETDEYYPIQDSWDKVKNHAVFGSLAGDFPEPVCSEGVKEVDIASLIGKNRTVRCNLFVDENTVAVISTAENTNWKIDFIDIKKNSAASHKLKEIEGMELNLYDSNHYSVTDNGFFRIYFYIPSTGSMIEYKVKLNTESNTEDEVKIFTPEEWVKYSDRYKLTSKSGRYSTFYKDYDLYLRDNKTKKDIFVYDAFYSEKNEDLNKIRIPQAAYFSGDILFFNITGSAKRIGNGFYDPATNKVNIFENNLSSFFSSNGYIYGTNSEDDYLYRFHINSPDKSEALHGDEIVSANIVSPDCQYIAVVEYSTDTSTSTIKIYTAADYKNVKTYTVKSPFLSFSHGININDEYLYLPANSYAFDSKAYLIKLG